MKTNRAMEHSIFHFGNGIIPGVLGCIVTMGLNLVHYIPAVSDGLHIIASVATIASAATTIFVLLYKLKKEK